MLRTGSDGTELNQIKVKEDHIESYQTEPSQITTSINWIRANESGIECNHQERDYTPNFSFQRDTCHMIQVSSNSTKQQANSNNLRDCARVLPAGVSCGGLTLNRLKTQYVSGWTWPECSTSSPVQSGHGAVSQMLLFTPADISACHWSIGQCNVTK